LNLIILVFIIFNLDKKNLHLICSFKEGINGAVSIAKIWNPDIVYNHGLSSLTLEAQVLKHWPAVFYCHTIHGTCLSGTKFWRRPKSVLCHERFGIGCLFRYGPNRCGGRNLLKVISLYQKTKASLRMLKKYRRILVASNWMLEVLLQNGLDPENVSLAPLFPVGSLPLPGSPSVRDQSNSLLFVGRIVENKGWRHAVEATAFAASRLNRKFRLVIAGTGPEAGKVDNFAKSNRVQVEFKGKLEAHQLDGLRCQADLQLVPSLTAEGFALVGIEAGCFGLPSAGYPSGGMMDWLISGETGEFTSSSEMNSVGLGEAICRALGSFDHWQRLRVGAWKKSREFNLEKHLDTVEKVLNECIDN